MTDSPPDVHPDFQRAYRKVVDRYFSRDPRYWPCFADAAFRRVIDFRRRNLQPADRLNAYPGGQELQRLLLAESAPPVAMRLPAGEADDLLVFAAALSKDWENPASVENVITMPCDPGVYGAMLGSLANPNLVYSEYAGMAHELEQNVIRQMAVLAGYSPTEATGIFTQGGTFCNLYGYLAGIRKSLPEARTFGMGYTHDYRFINSQGGHYSNVTNLSLLGVDIQKRTIRIQLTPDNDVDLDDLEQHLRACFRLGCAVPTIMLTMGTTDTFAVDRVRPVCELRDRLCEQYGIAVRPHVHVDSAIGWSLLFFLDYDFDRNPLAIQDETVAGLKRNVACFGELRYADSFTVDFQKWGYVPYPSSLVMFKNKSDLKHLEHDPADFSYFERDLQGRTHLQSTIECSRGATGVFGAYAALRYLGVEGYRIVIAHCLQNADAFRRRLRQFPNVKVVAPGNRGPSVGFRIYDPTRVADAEAEFAIECRMRDTEIYRERLTANTRWHRRLFETGRDHGLFTSWVEFVTHTDYDEHGAYHRVPGEKAVFMNPLTTCREIDEFVAYRLGPRP